MSAETIEWLAENTLIGFTEKRGNAWHYREGNDNHFEGAVPRERAVALLSYPLAESEAPRFPVLTEDGVREFVGTGRKGIVRLDTGEVLGVFKDGYRIHQPVEWTVENLDLLLDGGLAIGSVVVLKGGAVYAVQGELEETREAAEGVKHRPFILAAGSCDGSLSSTYLVGSQVVVCDNTLSVALGERGSSRVKVRHSRNSLGRIGEVRDSLGLLVEQAGDAFDAKVAKLTSEFVSDEVWGEFVKAYTGVEGAKEGRSATIAQNKVSALNGLWNHDDRVAPWRNNAYGVLAAVNTFEHHFVGAEASRAQRNQLRTVEGGWEAVDARALALLGTVQV
jgi:phage/plasmid-like protein (TIGR03299 family)